MTAAEQRAAMTPSHHPPKSGEQTASLPSLSLRQMGVLVLFASMSVLFTALLVGFWFTRLTSPHYREPGLPDLPRGLVLSTVLIGLTSFGIWQAQLAVRKNQLEALKRWLLAAGTMAVLFLLTQTANWFVMRPPSDANSLYLATFFLLTGVHALHVLGGFVPLGFVVHHALRKHYSSSSHEGLSLCAQYWHYLGAVWLVLVTMLYFGNR
jgi:heme/copper-type cytochrome/quinol oxidase subunit 3